MNTVKVCKCDACKKARSNTTSNNRKFWKRQASKARRANKVKTFYWA